MKRFSQPTLIGGLILILSISACTSRAALSPTPVGTVLANGQTSSPVPTSIEVTKTPLTPIIPITGENVVEMQCQFCVNGLTHAVFIFPDFAIFDVESSSPVTCLTAEVINGKRVLVCNGAQLTSFNLKICSDSSNCLLFPVALQACPLTAEAGQLTSTPMTPVFLTAINTLSAATPTRSQNNTSTPTPGASQAPTSTSSGSTPTSILPTLPPILTTVAPPPTEQPPQPTPTEPQATPGSTNDHRRPTKTPRT